MNLPWRMLLNRRPDLNKYDYGHVLVIGGSAGMGGAPILAAHAALRVGAGLVTIAAPKHALDNHEIPDELMTLSLNQWEDTNEVIKTINQHIQQRHISTVVIGPGMSKSADAAIRGLLSQIKLPVVVDAECFNALHEHLSVLAQMSRQNPDIILTPHTGEFAHLTDMSPDTFAKQYGVTTVLKKHHTTVVAADREPYINNTGNPGLATAGTGDVLSGIIAGILAQHIPAFEAAVMGVQLHGYAGDLAAKQNTEPGVIASDVIDYLPEALSKIEHVLS